MIPKDCLREIRSTVKATETAIKKNQNPAGIDKEIFYNYKRMMALYPEDKGVYENKLIDLIRMKKKSQGFVESDLFVANYARNIGLYSQEGIVRGVRNKLLELASGKR